MEKSDYLISHFDTDGITSATNCIKILKIELDSRFSLKIFPRLEKEGHFEISKR
jgi:single-stranded DNA-specific DHH superfamily exonuclease